MLLREVEYARPASVPDAVRLLGDHEGARALAGGQTIVNVMKARAAAPDVLVDLGALGELRTIDRGEDGSLRIGAMATYAQIMRSPDVGELRPVLGRVCATIADVQVRNRGTLGGNVCSNDPTNHLPPLMVATGARMHVVGRAGERVVPAEEFFLGVYMTAVGPGELLTHVSIPAGGRDGFDAVTLGADGTCIANAAASLDGDGGPRVAIGCVDAVPVRARQLEARLAEGAADERTIHDAAGRDAADLLPPSDVHASAEYRRHLAGVVAARAALGAA